MGPTLMLLLIALISVVKSFEINSPSNEIMELFNMTNDQVDGFLSAHPSDSHIKSLKFLESALTAIPFELLANMPNLQNITASYAKIQNIEDNNTYLNIHYVNLAFNHLSKLPDKVFKMFGNLKSIDLSWNLITEVANGAFSNLQQLTALDLAGNQIKELNFQVLVKCQALLVINLNHNHLQQLPNSIFKWNSNLQELSLRSNKLATVNGLLFQGTKKLEKLDLSSNQINRLDESAFRSLEGLTTLDLSSNGIKTLPKAVFSGLRALQDLYLHNNDMESFDFDVIKFNKKLDSIKLNKNRISWLLANRVNYNKRNPIRVYLSNNNLTDITNLANLNINVLDLSHNPDLALNASSFSQFSSLYSLTLKGVALNATVLQSGLVNSLQNLEVLDISSNDLRVIDVTSFPRKTTFFYVNDANLTEIIGYESINTILPFLKIFELERNIWNCTYFDELMLKVKQYSKRKLNTFSQSLYLNGVDCSLLRTTTTTQAITVQLEQTTPTSGSGSTTGISLMGTSTVDAITTEELISSSEATAVDILSTTDFFLTTENAPPTDSTSESVFVGSATESYYQSYVYKFLENDNVYTIIVILLAALSTALVLGGLFLFLTRQSRKGAYYISNNYALEYEMTIEFVA